MSKNVELSGILRNIANALRDASAALEAVQRILGALFPPQAALEARAETTGESDAGNSQRIASTFSHVVELVRTARGSAGLAGPGSVRQSIFAWWGSPDDLFKTAR